MVLQLFVLAVKALQDHCDHDCETESRLTITMILQCSITIKIFFIYSIQYLVMFNLKLHDMSTILQEYIYNYSSICNMIDTITMVIVGSMCISLLGIIWMVNGIVIRIVSQVLCGIFNIILLHAIRTHSYHHARFDLILFVNDAILNTFYALFVLFVYIMMYIFMIQIHLLIGYIMVMIQVLHHGVLI